MNTQEQNQLEAEGRRQEDASPTAGWKFRLLGSLAQPSARRIYTAAEFRSFVEQHRPGTSAVTARALAKALAAAGALRFAGAGVLVNRRCSPPAELIEIASKIRAGTVVSLHSVLGECGFLNNPSAIVTAVVPTSASKRPNLGEVRTATGDVFRFYGLSARFFPSSDQERWELYQPGRPCDMFRPEAALLHWIYLAGVARSRLTPPPLDVDMDALDPNHLANLAQRWDLVEALREWHERAKQNFFGEHLQRELTASALPSSAADRAAQAKERLMARRR